MRKDRTRVSWFPISNQEVDEWKKLCFPDKYCIYGQQDVPSPVPRELLRKCDSVFVAASGSIDGSVVYYMANLNRVDVKDYTIDQQPFGLALVGNYPAPSGVLIHHGNWRGRTTTPPRHFWDYILASGIGHCYPLSELPNDPSGSIYDLKIDSQKSAFTSVIDELKSQI